jgi:hypothetical protein
LNSSSLIKAGKLTARFSFLGGTGIMILFYFTNSIDVADGGLIYAFIVGLVNVFVIGLLIYRCFRDHGSRKKILRATAAMLLNIPVFLGYCWFALILFDTLRITITNKTGFQINNVRILGCEEKFVMGISPGESQTFWIHIPHECGVSIDYELRGQLEKDYISGYTSKGMGQIMQFDIVRDPKHID